MGLIDEKKTKSRKSLPLKVLALAHRKHWHPSRQSLHIGGFLLVAALEGLYHCSNVS
jgi:hypothetical protein